MTLSTVRAPVWLSARKTMVKPNLRRQVRRFAYRYRDTVSRLARQHSTLADLVFSFPALLFALACPHKGLDRKIVIQAVQSGAPLKKLAKLAHIPFWMVKLPPEAFDRPLRPLPGDVVFQARVGNVLPKDRKDARRWLCCAYSLAEWGTGEFVLWALRRVLHDAAPSWEHDCLRLIALHAWYSRHGKGLGADCNLQLWHSGLSFEKARARALSWHDMVKAQVHQSVAVLDDFWFEPAVVGGFVIEPLRNSHEIVAEGRRMKNCIASHVANVYCDHNRLWKVGRAGKTVAIAEVSRGNGLQLLAVTQLRGPANADVTADVALAVRRWQNLQPEHCLTPPKNTEALAFRQDVWRDLWRPYWKHMGRALWWLPFVGCETALSDLLYGGENW